MMGMVVAVIVGSGAEDDGMGWGREGGGGWWWWFRVNDTGCHLTQDEHHSSSHAMSRDGFERR